MFQQHLAIFDKRRPLPVWFLHPWLSATKLGGGGKMGGQKIILGGLFPPPLPPPGAATGELHVYSTKAPNKYQDFL